MTLRARINLIIASLMLVVVGTLTVVDLLGTRNAVREEISASHRIATQLVREVLEHYGQGNAGQLVQFLTRVGRVRSNDMTLYAADGQVLYRSPPSAYKQGRDAPGWYARLVIPDLQPVELPVFGGSLVIRSNASRAVLDGWDDMKAQMLGTLVLLLAVNLLVFAIVGRCLQPLSDVRAVLDRMGQGDYAVRLPRLPGAEAQSMGEAVNRLGAAIETNRAASLQAAQAEARLAAERGFVQELQSRIEAERRDLAASLHDEMGQSVTAVRTLAHTLVQRCGAAPGGDPAARRAGELLLRTTDGLYDAMHALIPRLRPPALDALGLSAAVADLVQGLRIQHPGIAFELNLPDAPDLALPEPLQIGAYRIVQEALTNVLRHAQATRVQVGLVRREHALHLLSLIHI